MKIVERCLKHLLQKKAKVVHCWRAYIYSPIRKISCPLMGKGQKWLRLWFNGSETNNFSNFLIVFVLIWKGTDWFSPLLNSVSFVFTSKEKKIFKIVTSLIKDFEFTSYMNKVIIGKNNIYLKSFSTFDVNLN